MLRKRKRLSSDKVKEKGKLRAPDERDPAFTGTPMHPSAWKGNSQKSEHFDRRGIAA